MFTQCLTQQISTVGFSVIIDFPFQRGKVRGYERVDCKRDYHPRDPSFSKENLRQSEKKKKKKSDTEEEMVGVLNLTQGKRGPLTQNQVLTDRQKRKGLFSVSHPCSNFNRIL